jgi:hypothetical protein
MMKNGYRTGSTLAYRLCKIEMMQFRFFQKMEVKPLSILAKKLVSPV